MRQRGRFTSATEPRLADWLDLVAVGTVAAIAAVVETVLVQAGQLMGYVRSRHVIYPQRGHA